MKFGGTGYSYDCVDYPAIRKFKEETYKIETKLAERKKEIRARIYGMDTTYEAVEKEIEKYISDIKI